MKNLLNSGAPWELNREPRKIGDGPAAVIRDEHRIKPLFLLIGDGKARLVG